MRSSGAMNGAVGADGADTWLSGVSAPSSRVRCSGLAVATVTTGRGRATSSASSSCEARRHRRAQALGSRQAARASRRQGGSLGIEELAQAAVIGGPTDPGHFLGLECLEHHERRARVGIRREFGPLALRTLARVKADGELGAKRIGDRREVLRPRRSGIKGGLVGPSGSLGGLGG